jgi:branched-chain amino acid transport system permease protein
VKKKNLTIVLLLLLTVALFFVPKFVKSQYTLHLIIMSCIYIILTQSLNLIAGYMGVSSLGHAAFYGIGAYTSVLLVMRLGWSFWVAIIASIVLAGFFGLILAIPALKLKSSYLIITTIAFGKIIHLLLVNSVPLTKGPLGIPGVPAPNPIRLGSLVIEFNTKAQYYYLAYFAMLLVMILYYRLINSRTGRAILSVREDDIAAGVTGINVVYYKVFAFVVGTATAGFAGAIYAHYIRFISPETFTIIESITLLIMMIVGGEGTFIGPVFGAVTITFLLEKLRFLNDFRLIIYGVILFVVIYVMPRGLMQLAEFVGTRAKRVLQSKPFKEKFPNLSQGGE